MKWRFFFGAAVLVAYGMLAAGAPVETVALGIVLTALLNFVRQRKNSRRA
jgi:Flp pilus assembly protein TadB